MKNLTEEQKKNFYEWLEQFISEKGYEIYYNPTDGGEYRIITTEGTVLYQGTYEYNNWIEIKTDEFINCAKN